jgi:hypothetical protein
MHGRIRKHACSCLFVCMWMGCVGILYISCWCIELFDISLSLISCTRRMTSIFPGMLIFWFFVLDDIDQSVVCVACFFTCHSCDSTKIFAPRDSQKLFSYEKACCDWSRPIANWYKRSFWPFRLIGKVLAEFFTRILGYKFWQLELNHPWVFIVNIIYEYRPVYRRSSFSFMPV